VFGENERLAGGRIKYPFEKQFIFTAALVMVLLLGACEIYSYGKIGGADKTERLRPDDPHSTAAYEELLDFLSGVWYSHYAGIGRLDGYRIGKWKEFAGLVEERGKIALFPDAVPPYAAYTGNSVPNDDDYFVLYDDTVYGQTDDGSPGQRSWGFAYIGIVRAVNIFNGDTNRGAIIIEYLKGCAPQWDSDIRNGQRPFFGIYYRVHDSDTVQMANAVDLEALYAGEKYYTETATLEEAISRNTVENEAEFISWGAVISQNRENE
jgi:hypothetical protein